VGFLKTIPGVVLDPMNLPSGCTFHPRCTIAEKRCKNEEPILEEKRKGHLVRCWNV